MHINYKPQFPSVSNKNKNTTFLENTTGNLACLLRCYAKEARASQIVYKCSPQDYLQ